MKQRISILALLLIVLAAPALAQPAKGNRKEKVEQLKIAYITKELDLTTEEAEKFWPAYNEMTEALRKERRSRKAIVLQLKTDFETLSEEDVKKKTQEILKSEIKEAELKKEHTEKIAAIIGYKKTVELITVEQKFKQELLKKLKEHRSSNQNNN